MWGKRYHRAGCKSSENRPKGNRRRSSACRTNGPISTAWYCSKGKHCRRRCSSIHRFRRVTEPWALEALAYVGAGEHADAVRAARAADPSEPLLRGDDLGVTPGPEVGRLLELVEEERAAGTIATREEALELVRRSTSGT